MDGLNLYQSHLSNRVDRVRDTVSDVTKSYLKHHKHVHSLVKVILFEFIKVV